MSDTIDDYKSMGDHKKRLRAKYGVECPECKRLQPKRSATILLPQQRCRVDGYRDPRPDLTEKEWSEA
jgi:hypothetical protein